MKEALFYKKLKDKVQCELCPNFCTLKKDEIGKCNARKNINGRLYSLSYGKLVAMNVDPIEKKPLYHFLPGSKALSIGTAGCNLHCKWCQNYNISQASPEDFSTPELLPEKVIELAKREGCKSIAYTYTEPTVFYEYVLELSKLAKKHKLKNIWVTNGFINPEPLKKIVKYIDAANVDLKSMSDEVYRKYCSARLKPILDTIKFLQNKVHLEITNLLIPTVNDKDNQIKKLVRFVKELNVPLHFSAYYPSYKMKIHSTPSETVKRARKIALDEGLKYVYTGNIIDSEGSDTYCSNCGEVVIERRGYSVKSLLKKGKCRCGEEIKGEF